MSLHSTNSPPNYMDGVPVKISENYKPPPKVTIPQSIVNRLNSEGYPIGLFDYDFTLETNVIRKIDEWKKVRELEREKRQERLRKHEIERAREIEEKQKQLLTAVSYPNAEDLSSGEDDDSPEDSSSTTASGGTKIKTNLEKKKFQQFSALQQQRFDTILMPTVVPDCSPLNTSPEIYQQNCAADNKPTSSKINYSDFENDTSSPFDNIELKTINDLDVLAQVLNVTQIHSNPNNLEASNTNINPDEQHQTTRDQIINKSLTNFNYDYYRNSANSTPTGETIAVVSGGQWNTIDKSNNLNHVVHHSDPNQTNLYCPSNNIFYSYDTPTTLLNYANMNGRRNIAPAVGIESRQSGQQQQNNMQGNNTDFYYNYNLLSGNQNYLYNSYPTDIRTNNIEYSDYQQKQNFINSQQQHQNENLPVQQPMLYCHQKVENMVKNDYTLVHQNTSEIGNAYGNNESSAIYSAKNKSKSVPDILQELNDEIRDSEIRRARNHSQTLEDHDNKITENSQNVQKYTVPPEIFLKLSPSSQCLVQNISSMGFPLERVARIAEKLGNDDKKIFEHLIPLSELLDLGFEESKISEALLKFNNNKEKALDFLIS